MKARTPLMKIGQLWAVGLPTVLELSISFSLFYFTLKNETDIVAFSVNGEAEKHCSRGHTNQHIINIITGLENIEGITFYYF